MTLSTLSDQEHLLMERLGDLFNAKEDEPCLVNMPHVQRHFDEGDYQDAVQVDTTLNPETLQT